MNQRKDWTQGSMLQTRYKHIHFKKENQALISSMPYYLIINNRHGDFLGVVEYYKPWKKWILSRVPNETAFSIDCLADIQNFMGQLK